MFSHCYLCLTVIISWFLIGIYQLVISNENAVSLDILDTHLFENNAIIKRIIISFHVQRSVWKSLYGRWFWLRIPLPYKRCLRSSTLTIYDYRQVSSLDWLTSYLLSLLFYMITFANTSVWSCILLMFVSGFFCSLSQCTIIVFFSFFFSLSFSFY